MPIPTALNAAGECSFPARRFSGLLTLRLRFPAAFRWSAPNPTFEKTLKKKKKAEKESRQTKKKTGKKAITEDKITQIHKSTSSR